MKVISDISFVWSLPLFLGCVFVSFLFYFVLLKKSSFSTKIKLFLSSLRAFGLFLLCLLLCGIFLSFKHFRTEKPILFIALDESKSMLNYVDSTSLKKKLTAFVSNLSHDVEEKFTVKKLKFGKTVSDFISFKYDQNQSNIGAIFDDIHQQYVKRNVGAIVLISDGNYNEGSDPVFASKKLKFVPVFSVLVGDTSTKKDLFIRSIFNNDLAFSGSIFPIEIQGEAQQLPQENISISLYQNDKLLETVHLQTTRARKSSFSHTFQIKANGKGFQRFTVKLKCSSKEYTLSNNQKSTYIELIDQRKKIILLSDGIHPDIGVINSVLKKNDRVETQVLFSSKLNELPTCDLIVVYHPERALSPNILKSIQEAKTPALFILGSNIQADGLKKFNLGMSNLVSKKTERVQAEYNPNFKSIQFSNECIERVSTFPPLIVPFAMNWETNSSTLLLQKLDGMLLNRPLIGIQIMGGTKIGVIYGQGLWRWKLMEQKKYGDTQAFDELVSKLIQYLSVQANTSKFRVFPPKSSSNEDDIEFRAEFYNDAFQLITEPEITLQLKNEKQKIVAKTSFQKNKVDYQANLGKLNPGKYTWKAQTSFSQREYSKEGEFVVNEISKEFQTNSANFNTMNELALSSNGKMFHLQQEKKLVQELLNRKEISSVQFEENSFQNLLDFKWLFVLIIFIFTLEWAVKRWLGAY